MKLIVPYTLFLLPVIYSSCGRQSTQSHEDHFNYAIVDTVSSYGPNTMVRNVKQASNGTILIAASWSGVWRYDGKLFTKLTSKIGSRRYWDVLEDRRGNLWFASTDSGVYRYDGKIFQHFTTREGLANNRVMVIYQDRAGTIWLGTGHGLSRYDGKSFKNFTTKDGLTNNDINTIMEDSIGRLWIGTRGEACIYDGKIFTVFRNKDGNSFKNVWSIMEGQRGDIWFGDVKGLWRYDGNSYTHVSQRSASSITQDKKGNIWTTGSGRNNVLDSWSLSRYDRDSLYNNSPAVTEIMSKQRMLFRILEADDGSIWFGSIHGVFRYDGKKITDFKNATGDP